MNLIINKGNKKSSSSIDVCFVIPSTAKKAYQDLSKTYSAIEPPTWALLLAQSLRKNKYESVILDFEANFKKQNESIEMIENTKSKLVIFVLYGHCGVELYSLSCCFFASKYVVIVPLSNL